MFTILIVDDERITREGIVSQINWKECEIDTILQAEDGEQALQIAKHVNVDIVLTDVRMPLMDGIELTRALKEHNNKIHIIFMSGYSDKEYLLSAINLRVHHYILKPFAISDMEEKIQEIIKICKKEELLSLEQIKMEEEIEKSIPFIKSELALLATMSYLDQQKLAQSMNSKRMYIQPKSFYLSVLFRYFIDISIDKKVQLDLLINRYSLLEDELKRHGYICICSDKREPYYIMHITTLNPNECECIRPEHIAGIIKYWIQHENGFKMFCGIGGLIKGLDHVYKSYQEAHDLLDECFYLGYNSVIIPHKKELSEGKIDFSEISKIINCIKAETIEKILWQWNCFITNCKMNRRLKSAVVKNNIYQILLNLLKTAFANDDNSFQQEDYRLLDNLMKMNTIDELDEYVKEFIKECFSHISTFADNSNIKKIVRYIESNFQKSNMSISEISQHTFLSPSYMCTAFKKEMGCTINQYITEFRIKKAKDFLGNRNNRISDVAKYCGYDDSNYFTRLFKKNIGLSPSDFRERIGVYECNETNQKNVLQN